MDLRSGYPLSLIRNGLPFDYPKLDASLETDVVIIGGGISGALAAHSLRDIGVDTIVLDGRTAGLGSTCASTSLLLYEIDIPLCLLRKRIGQQAADRAYLLSQASVYSLEKLAGQLGFPHFKWANSLYCADTKRRTGLLEAEYAARRSIGLDVSWYDSAGLHAEYGLDSAAAILSRCAAKTDAYLLTHAIHQHNIKKGVRVFDRTYMAGFEAGRRGIRLMTSEGHVLRAKHLVFANGYEAQEQLPERIASLHSTYVVASEQMQQSALGALQDVVVWTTGDPYLYMSTTADNRLMVGGRDEPFYSPRRRDRLIGRKGYQLGKDLEKLAPSVSFTKEFSWTGTFATTPDGLPYIGQYPGIDNCYFALGFGGNGITFAMLAAEMIAAMIGGHSNKDASLFSFGRK